MTKHGIMPPMAKDESITLRTKTSEVKRAIEVAARNHGRTVSNYLLWLAMKDDPAVAAAYESATTQGNETELQRGLRDAAEQSK